MDPGQMLPKAIAEHDLRAVERTLDGGLDVNTALDGGLRPLFYAALGGDLAIMQMLLDRGADVNAREDDGATALHLAVSVWTEGDTVEQKRRVCELLLRHGADITARNNRGSSPLDDCRQSDHPELAALLGDFRATSPDYGAVVGYTPAPSPAPPPNSPLEQAQRWAEEAIGAASLHAGLALVDRIPTLQGEADADQLQACYATALTNLTSRARNAQEAEEVLGRLFVTPRFLSDKDLQAHAARALGHATVQARPVRKGKEIAGLFPRFPDYQTREDLQVAHAKTLFQISVETRNGFQAAKLAEEIRRLPAFSTSEAVQFEAAKTLCNASGFASNTAEAQRYAADITSLPRSADSEGIRDAHARALRNAERHARGEDGQTGVPIRDGPGVREVAGGLGRGGQILVAALVGLLLIGIFGQSFRSRKPGNRPDPKPSRTVSIPDETPVDKPDTDAKMIVGRYLEQARVQLEKGNYDSAAAFARTGLETAKKRKVDSQPAIKLLAKIHEEAGQPEKALQYYYDFPRAEQLKLRDQRMEEARIALKARRYDDALAHSSIAVKLDKIAGGDATEIQEFQASVQVEAGRVGKAMAIYSALIEEFPDRDAYRKKLTQLRTEQAVNELNLTREAFQQERWDDADEHGETAAKLLGPMPEHRQELIEAWTFLAKTAYLTGRYSVAVDRMKVVVELDPGNTEQVERLEAYRTKDRMVVTPDELADVSMFQFPDPIVTEERWTYVTVVSADKGQQTWTSKSSQIHASTSSYDKDRVTVSIQNDGDWSQISLDSGKGTLLTPGTYVDDQAYSYSSQGTSFEFRGGGLGCDASTGRVVVHELVLGKDNREVLRLAMDFLGSCGAGKHVYGKLRYHSKFN